MEDLVHTLPKAEDPGSSKVNEIIILPLLTTEKYLRNKQFKLVAISQR